MWHLRWWFFVKLIKTCAEAVACNDVVLLVLRQRRWDSSSFMHINSRSSSPVPPPLSLLLPLSHYNTILWCDAILSYFWWWDQVGLYLILFLDFYCCLAVMLDFNAIFGSANFSIFVAAYDAILHFLASFYNSVSAQFDGRRLSLTTVCSFWVLSVLLL